MLTLQEGKHKIAGIEGSAQERHQACITESNISPSYAGALLHLQILPRRKYEETFAQRKKMNGPNQGKKESRIELSMQKVLFAEKSIRSRDEVTS